MKIDEFITTIPELSEEKLLQTIEDNLDLFKSVDKNGILERLEYFNRSEVSKGEYNISKAILKEYDLIQDKGSNLTKSQRDKLTGFVSFCLVQMAKINGGENRQQTDESRNDNGSTGEN